MRRDRSLKSGWVVSPRITSKQILKETGNLMRRLAHLLERLQALQEINRDSDLDDLVPAVGQSLLELAR